MVTGQLSSLSRIEYEVTSEVGLTSAWLFSGLDVSVNGPDEQSIITYVSQFLEHFPGLEEVGSPP